MCCGRGLCLGLIMAKISNKEIEKNYFELFRKKYSLPLGQIEYGDKPDVIIYGPKKIGIEITNFYLEDGSLSKSEQNKNSFAKLLLITLNSFI